MCVCVCVCVCRLAEGSDALGRDLLLVEREGRQEVQLSGLAVTEVQYYHGQGHGKCCHGDPRASASTSKGPVVCCARAAMLSCLYAKQFKGSLLHGRTQAGCGGAVVVPAIVVALGARGRMLVPWGLVVACGSTGG